MNNTLYNTRCKAFGIHLKNVAYSLAYRWEKSFLSYFQMATNIY